MLCEEIQEDGKEMEKRLTYTITYHCQREKRKNPKVEILWNMNYSDM